MPNWLVQLEGDPFDLQALAFLVKGEALEVERRGDRFLLRATAFNDVDSDQEVQRRAGRLLELVNGAASLSIESYTHVGIHGVVQVDADGQLVYPVIVSMSVTMAGRSRVLARATVVRPDGSVEPEPEHEIISWTQLAAENSEVALALRLLDKDAGRWCQLYKLYELVEGDVGQQSRISSMGWTTDEDIKRFKRTANDRAVVGGDARHMREDASVPYTPMSLQESEAFVRSLLRAWISNAAQGHLNGRR